MAGMDRYQIISELTFYDSDQSAAMTNHVGSHLFGQGSLMFEEWSTKEAAEGKNLILISWDAKDVRAASLGRRFANLTSMEEGIVHYHGRAVRPFYYRIGYGYHSHR